MTIEIRNPQHASGGSIDCEINHPDFGWIPFTATADDPYGFVPEVWAALQLRTDIAPAPPPPAPTTAEVTAYAEELIELGVTINVAGITAPIYVQGRGKDTRNVQGLVTAAQLRLAAGDTTTLTAFRDGNNVTHQLVPGQIVELWQKSSAYISLVYAASWSIKEDDPISAGFRADARWPNPDQTAT
jgi:hypothetical protein